MEKNEETKRQEQTIEVKVPENDYSDTDRALYNMVELLRVDVKLVKEAKSREHIVKAMQDIKDDLGKVYGLASQLMKEKLKELEHTVE